MFDGGNTASSARRITDPIFKQPRLREASADKPVKPTPRAPGLPRYRTKASEVAPILYGAGYPVILFASLDRGRGSRPPTKCRGGWSAARRIRILIVPRFGEKARAPYGAPRRLRVSAIGCKTQAPVPRFLGRGFRTVPVQRAPRGGVLMPLGRISGASRVRGYEPRARAPHRRCRGNAPSAGPGSADAASPAPGSPGWLRHRDVSRRRPSDEPGGAERARSMWRKYGIYS